MYGWRKIGPFCNRALHCPTTQGTAKVPQGSRHVPQPPLALGQANYCPWHLDVTSGKISFRCAFVSLGQELFTLPLTMCVHDGLRLEDCPTMLFVFVSWQIDIRNVNRFRVGRSVHILHFSLSPTVATWPCVNATRPTNKHTYDAETNNDKSLYWSKAKIQQTNSIKMQQLLYYNKV